MGYVVNLVLEGKLAVVVGGGKVAERKIADLLEAGATVTVVAEEPSARIRGLAEQKLIDGYWRKYSKTDLYGAYLAIAATDDEGVNGLVYKDAQTMGVLANVVDRPALCDFTVPASVRRGDLTIAVATNGQCPALSGVLREELECRYGEEYGELVRLMSDLRRQMTALGWDGTRIRTATRALYRDGVVEAIAIGDRRLLCHFIEARLGPEFDVHPGIGLKQIPARRP